jgi:hypothetical protein
MIKLTAEVFIVVGDNHSESAQVSKTIQNHHEVFSALPLPRRLNSSTWSENSFARVHVWYFCMPGKGGFNKLDRQNGVL